MSDLDIKEPYLIEYISEEFNPANNIGNFKHIANTMKINDIMPIIRLQFKFSSDTWDIAPLLSEEKRKITKTRFIFTEVPCNFKDYTKYFIYWNLTQVNKKKYSTETLVNDLKGIRKFFKYLETQYISSIDNIDYTLVFEYIKNLHDSGLEISTLGHYVSSIKKFLVFYNNNMTDKDLLDLILQINKSTKELSTMISIYRATNKTADIPSEYFNNLISTCIKIMDSESLDDTIRGYSAMLVLLSQTGLRVKQLCCLKSNAVSKVSILNGEKTAYFLEFFESKKRNEISFNVTCKTILNDLGYRAYILLEELCKTKRDLLKTDFLFCPPNSPTAPTSPDTFRKNVVKLIIKIGHDIGAVNNQDKYPSLPTTAKYSEFCKANSMNNKELNRKYNADDIISYPTPHQFRVHLCTELYHKNVPLQVIQHYMNHLTADMTDYYIRREEYTKKEDGFASSVIRTIVEEDTKPLGVGSDKLMVKIDEFIKKGNFNIRKDMDTVISELTKRMPIKEKSGGICIKSGPKRDCSKDGQSDELYCAYGICPNHFHLYTMTDISYTKCKALSKTMEHNKTQGFMRQSQKEKNKLIHVIEKSLKPELEQLKDKIKEKGSDWIKSKYPDLITIIDNLDTIEKEVESWLKLK